jgi:hypothetical protein
MNSLAFVVLLGVCLAIAWALLTMIIVAAIKDPQFRVS